MRIRGGLFTRAPECRLNGLEMDLSQIRAVARGGSQKGGGGEKGSFDEEQMQIKIGLF